MSICSKQEETGIHVQVRCSGCGSTHHTKNIGCTDETTHTVSCYRSVFDVKPCQCLDPKAYPLVHVCGIDCGDEDKEAIAAIEAKYEALKANNIARASIFCGFEVSEFCWDLLLKWDGERARSFLTGKATEEDKQDFKAMHERAKAANK